MAEKQEVKEEKWKIYEPVTDFGKEIAKCLRRDDSIRLEVHDVLQKWEPKILEWKEKAEKWDKMMGEIYYKLYWKDAR